MKKSVLVITLALWMCAPAYAHGVGFRQSDMKAVTLEFFYSTGEKMSYREARVFSPRDGKFAAQTGRTDEQGRFAFIPDTPGEWRVIVRDEEGHQCEAKLVISDELSAADERASASQSNSSLPQGTELLIRALLGVSIIFNIAMIIRWRSGHAH
ncbi:MAG: hypothetical protein IJS28_09380 [Synergistaceae bacterium]|nr:hypothetical protein [Synergistaceae bacterium]